MKIGTMFFSLLQVPRCRINNIANYWDGSFHSLCKTYGNNSSVRLLGSRIYGQEGGHSKKWTRRPVTMKTEGKGNKQTTRSTKSRSIKHEITNETILTSAAVNVNKTQLVQFQDIQYCDIQQDIAQRKDLSSIVTVIVFDIETTGLSRAGERIIEIALRDLQGGENSTFQTLVNPQRYVPNSHIHGITTQMVNRPDVPRYSEVLWIVHILGFFGLFLADQRFSLMYSCPPPPKQKNQNSHHLCPFSYFMLLIVSYAKSVCLFRLD